MSVLMIACCVGQTNLKFSCTWENMEVVREWCVHNFTHCSLAKHYLLLVYLSKKSVYDKMSCPFYYCSNTVFVVFGIISKVNKDNPSLTEFRQRMVGTTRSLSGLLAFWLRFWRIGGQTTYLEIFEYRFSFFKFHFKYKEY